MFLICGLFFFRWIYSFYFTVPTGLSAYVPAHTKHQFGTSCRDEGDNNNNDDDCHVVGNLGTTLVGRRSIRFAGCDSRPSLAHSPLVFAVVNTHAHAEAAAATATERQQRQLNRFQNLFEFEFESASTRAGQVKNAPCVFSQALALNRVTISTLLRSAQIASEINNKIEIESRCVKVFQQK